MRILKPLSGTLKAIGRRHCRARHLASWKPVEDGRKCDKCGREWVRTRTGGVVTRSAVIRAGAPL